MDFYNDELNHSGVPGMKHGVRRWQYLDGSRESETLQMGKKD